MRLIINTHYPPAVADLLAKHDLVERHCVTMPEGRDQLVIQYPDDALSQELVFWFAMATGCGLVQEYRTDRLSPEDRAEVERMERIVSLARLSDEELAKQNLTDEEMMDVEQYLNVFGG